ncbi:MAG: IS4 family transposase [bacterium]
MKRKQPFSPAGFSYTILKQVCNLIPPHVVNRLAKVHGVDRRSRDFTPWSHVVSLLYAQLTHAVSLNDVCDGLRMNAGALTPIRGASAPAKNTLSHANRERSALMAEALYWEMMEHLMTQSPPFAKGKVRRGYLRRFRTAIHAMDSTTIKLVAKSMDWAKHRRRKAAAKCHLRLNLQSFLPECVIIDTAKFHDDTKARALCAGLQAGEIAVFDKAYVDFDHLASMDNKGVFWVCRAKNNMNCRVVAPLDTTDNPRILRDEVIELVTVAARRAYPKTLRRVVALVEVDGEDCELQFLTNHMQWSAWTVAELYRCRWDIEVFFKEIKQTIQLADFLGHNANAVQWQIWTGLLTHLLVRYLAFLHSWQHSFTRLFTVVRAVLWRRWHLGELLDCYGTAKPPGRLCAAPQQAYLWGLT